MNSTKFLTRDEREALERMLKDRLDRDTRNATMILLALHSGARANELLALSWSDINTALGTVFIRTLKGGSPREIALPKYLTRALARLKELSPDRPFPISYTRLGEIWREYRPCRKPFHSLRHTFAMHVYEKTKDIRFTQKALGHRSITNTMVYADYSYTAQQFRKLMNVR